MNSKTLFNTFVGVSVVVLFMAFVTNITNHTVTATAPEPNLTPLVLDSTVPSWPVTARSKSVLPKTVHRVHPNPARTIGLYGEVGRENSYQIAEAIKQLGSESKEPIYLLINSPGGSVLDGALIVSAMEGSLAPVHTVCVQLCASMAAIIHQYGKERMMVDRSILMFHDASGGLGGSLPQMNTRLNQITQYVGKLNTMIAKRAGLTLDEYNRSVAYERWIDAEDATALKFNDKIVSVTLLTVLKAATDPETEKLKQSINLDWK